MHTIVICDDDTAASAAIDRIVNEYAAARFRTDIETVVFNDPRKAAQITDASIYLLDIVMPQMSGLELCELLRKNNAAAKIVFFTTSREFAIDAFRLRAVHYLLKPIDCERLFSVLDEIFEPMRSKTVSVQTKQGIVSVDVDQVVFLEYSDHRIRCVLNHGRDLCGIYSRKPFAEQAAAFLQAELFLRPHEAFFVNPFYIRRFQPSELTMKSGHKIPISKLRKPEIKEAYMDYLSRRDGRADV